MTHYLMWISTWICVGFSNKAQAATFLVFRYLGYAFSRVVCGCRCMCVCVIFFFSLNSHSKWAVCRDVFIVKRKLIRFVTQLWLYTLKSAICRRREHSRKFYGGLLPQVDLAIGDDRGGVAERFRWMSLAGGFPHSWGRFSLGF